MQCYSPARSSLASKRPAANGDCTHARTHALQRNVYSMRRVRHTQSVFLIPRIIPAQAGAVRGQWGKNTISHSKCSYLRERAHTCHRYRKPKRIAVEITTQQLYPPRPLSPLCRAVGPDEVDIAIVVVFIVPAASGERGESSTFKSEAHDSHSAHKGNSTGRPCQAE